MSLQFLKPAVVCLLLTFGLPYTTQVQAHGGLSLADDICKLTIGPYTMHFTGYQPEATQEKEFCEDIPAKVYPNGSINFEYDFMQPGKFIGLVTVRDKEEHVSRFPFSVGEPKGTSPYLIVAIAAVIGAGAFFFLRGRRKPADISPT